MIPARQHHVDDREVLDRPLVTPGHVAEIPTGHLDFAAHEALVNDLDLAHLVVRHDALQVDVAVALEALAFLGRYVVDRAIAAKWRHDPGHGSKSLVRASA